MFLSTVVGCRDGAVTQTIGSATICIVGKSFHTPSLDSPPLCKGQQHVLRGGSVSEVLIETYINTHRFVGVLSSPG